MQQAAREQEPNYEELTQDLRQTLILTLTTLAAARQAIDKIRV